MRLILILFALTFLSSCQNNNNEIVSIDPHHEEIELDKKEADSLWQKALNAGNFDRFSSAVSIP